MQEEKCNKTKNHFAVVCERGTCCDVLSLRTLNKKPQFTGAPYHVLLCIMRIHGFVRIINGIIIPIIIPMV